MADDNYILGLDLGTKKVAALLGKSRGGQITLCGIGLAASEGIRRGEVVDMEKASDAITKAMANLSASYAGVSQPERGQAGPEHTRRERAALAKADSGRNTAAIPRLPGRAWVGITGDHIRCYNPRAEIPLPRPGRAVSARDVEEVLRVAVGTVAIPAGYEVIHVIARTFAIDDAGQTAKSASASAFRNSISNPVGMPANRLAVQAHIIAASATALSNLERCVEHAGLAVEGVVLEPLASADAVLSDAERDLGVALIDIGAGTTDIAIFVDGAISYTGAIPIGGNHVTRDLAVGLEIDLEDAEELKLASGSALIDAIGADERVSIRPLSDEATRQIPRKVLAEIIEPRAVEMLSLAKEKMVQSGYFHRLSVGAVLSGGGSLLENLLPVAKQVLGIPVRLGRPIAKGTDSLKHPSFATGVGLLLYGSHEHIHHPTTSWNHVKPNLVARLTAWWKHLFGP